MNTYPLSKGPLAVFRLFTAIRLALALLGFLISQLNLPSGVGLIELYSVYGIVESGLLLFYLSWPWAQKRLGKWYLPIALVIATLGPELAAPTMVAPFESFEISIARSLIYQWQSIVILLFPLILISWQYRYRIVAGYALLLLMWDYLPVVFMSQGRVGLVQPIFLGGVFRTLLYLLIGYAIHRLAEELRQQNTRLEQANRSLANYALVSEQLAVSRERNRLAREMHDTLAHTLSGLAVQLEAAQTIWGVQPGQAQQIVQGALDQTRLGLKDTRRAIQALRATPLDDLGLGMALEQMARGFSERMGIKMDIQLPAQPLKLNPDTEHSLFRIAEEALRNIEQHAQARTAGLSLTQAGSQVCLSVWDNGLGFDLSTPPGEERFGLLGMRERAESVGGDLTIDSRPGQGTRVRFCIEV